MLFLFNADHPLASLCELFRGTQQLPLFFIWLHSSFHYASTISVKAVQCAHFVWSMVHGRIRVTSLVTNKADLLGSFCITANIHSTIIFPIICLRIGLVLNIIIVALGKLTRQKETALFSPVKRLVSKSCLRFPYLLLFILIIMCYLLRIQICERSVSRLGLGLIIGNIVFSTRVWNSVNLISVFSVHQTSITPPPPLRGPGIVSQTFSLFFHLKEAASTALLLPIYIFLKGAMAEMLKE